MSNFWIRCSVFIVRSNAFYSDQVRSKPDQKSPLRSWMKHEVDEVRLMTFIWPFYSARFLRSRFLFYRADINMSRDTNTAQFQYWLWIGPSVKNLSSGLWIPGSENSCQKRRRDWYLNRFRCILRKTTKKVKNKWSFEAGTYGFIIN